MIGFLFNQDQNPVVEFAQQEAKKYNTRSFVQHGSLFGDFTSELRMMQLKALEYQLLNDPTILNDLAQLTNTVTTSTSKLTQHIIGTLNEDKVSTAPNDVTSEFDLMTERPNVSWNDILGLDQQIQDLKSAVKPAIFQSYLIGNMRALSTVMLLGPPGTGKTELVRALATEMKCSMVSKSAADLTSKWKGESGKQIQKIFQTARNHSPCIIFIDEIDAILPNRNAANLSQDDANAVGQFLVEINGINAQNQGVVLIGATNRWDQLDDATQNRFRVRINVPLPENKEIYKDMFNRLFSSPWIYPPFVPSADQLDGWATYALQRQLAPREIRSWVSNAVSKAFHANTFAVVVNPETGKLRLVNAGTPNAIIYNSFEEIPRDQLESVQITAQNMIDSRP